MEEEEEEEYLFLCFLVFFDLLWPFRCLWWGPGPGARPGPVRTLATIPVSGVTGPGQVGSVIGAPRPGATGPDRGPEGYPPTGSSPGGTGETSIYLDPGFAHGENLIGLEPGFYAPGENCLYP